MNWHNPHRVLQLRTRRNRLEGQLRRCEVADTRDYYTLRIENINILLTDMGLLAYGNQGNRRKPKF